MLLPKTFTTVDDWLLHAPVQASAPERHLWLIALLNWVRQGEPVSGVQYVLRRLEDDAQARQQVVHLLGECLRDLHLSSLLADQGFAPRAALLSELGERLRQHVLPATPDTQDLGRLFGLLFHVRHDHAWMAALDEGTLNRLATLLGEAWQQVEPDGWRSACLEGLRILASHVRAAGLSRDLRMRLAGHGSKTAMAPFFQLARAAEDLHDAIDAGDQRQLLQRAQFLRVLVDRCASLAEGVHTHLETYGVSVDVVFQIDQLQARCQRMEQLINCVLSPQPAQEVRTLVLSLLRHEAERRSVRALFRQHYALLAKLVAERSAETGEHYITRTRAEYMDMLRRAAGGGLVIVGTTFAKFMLLALGLSVFWSGFAAGANYAVSFVLIHLLHWTVATKQPAMTAPALAARLRHTASEAEVEGFVDEVANLMRSQVAGIVGNLVVVAPVVVAVQVLAWWLAGQPLIDEAQARYVLHNLTLLGPTVLFAAFTGTLLFASSLVAGWVENWFVWHRLDSAMRWHPRARAVLGHERAARWAHWWRQNIAGMAANVSLGLMLGITPALATFFGLPLDVRHVTLSTGQIAAALGTLGNAALQDPAFWWCVAAIPLTGLFNVGVSFLLALRVAVRSREVRVKDRRRLALALWQGLLQHPRRFLLPPAKPAAASAPADDRQ